MKAKENLCQGCLEPTNSPQHDWCLSCAAEIEEFMGTNITLTDEEIADFATFFSENA